MGENTKIHLAHHSFNPWYGCQKVGPGCDNCYAESWAKRSGLVKWGPKQDRVRSRKTYWRKPIKWNAEAERLGIRYRVFCASAADVFDNAAPAEWRADLFDLIAQTPRLDWMLLTKRIGNCEKMIGGSLPCNVWLGITVCNQDEADRDIPKLLATPATKQFLSIEPLLGSVNLRRQMELRKPDGGGGIHWVICGGETGPYARAMHPDWARSLRDQCIETETPFFFKQWGEWVPYEEEYASEPFVVAHDGRSFGAPWLPDLPIGCVKQGWIREPSGIFYRRERKKPTTAAMLDGKEYEQVPL